MKKTRYKQYVVWLLMLVGGGIGVQAQVPVTGIVPSKTNIVNSELDKLTKECSTWSTQSPTPQRFREVNQKLLNLAKNEQLKGPAYLRLGRNYANVNNERLRNDSLAIYYLKQSTLHLPLPQENDLYSIAIHNLGREYLYPGENQNAYLTAEYLGESFKLTPQSCPDYGDMFMFGWGVKKDLFLAANIYAISLLCGNSGSMDQMNYINYFIENLNTAQYDTRAFEGMEYFIYANYILRDGRKGFYAISMAAELSLPSAMLELGLLYANNLAGADEETNRREAFRWFREGANRNYAPSILGLSRFCRYNIVDTLKGDIYHKDAKGNYSKEIRLKVINQSLDLLKRAAEMGYAQAQLDYGSIMMNKPKMGLGKPDYIEAAKWITAVAQSTSINGEAMMDVLQHRMDTAKIQYDPNEYAKACAEGRRMSSAQQYQFSNTLENILKHNNMSHPSDPKSTPIKHQLTKEQIQLKERYGVPDEDHDDLILAIGYRNVYEVYIDILKEMAEPSKLVNQSKRRFIQGNMTRLRIYSEGQKYNLVKQSPWEEWNGR